MNPVSPYLNRFDGEVLSSEDFLAVQNKPSDQYDRYKFLAKDSEITILDRK
jgi:hypothetical protein